MKYKFLHLFPATAWYLVSQPFSIFHKVINYLTLALNLTIILIRKLKDVIILTGDLIFAFKLILQDKARKQMDKVGLSSFRKRLNNADNLINYYTRFPKTVDYLTSLVVKFNSLKIDHSHRHATFNNPIILSYYNSLRGKKPDDEKLAKEERSFRLLQGPS